MCPVVLSTQNLNLDTAVFFEAAIHFCPLHREERIKITNICALPLLLFLVEYLALAGLMKFLAQLSDRIHHFTVYNLMPLAFLTCTEYNAVK